MKEITLVFGDIKDRADEAKRCLNELIPCQAQKTELNEGILIKKEYSSDEEYAKIMMIKEKYHLVQCCSAFVYFDDFVGRDETYVVVHKDVFPSIVDIYDDALTKVRDKINWILSETFFKGTFQIYPIEEISPGVTDQCPESRRYELEIWDGNQDQLLHGFIYQKGEFIKTTGDIDMNSVASMWKEK